MGVLQKAVGSIWAAFVVFCVCLGFLADFPSGRDQLEGSISAILPIAAALMPYIAIAGITYFGSRIVYVLSIWSVDRINGGPKKRAFIAKQSEIQRCKNLLIQYGDEFLRLLDDKGRAYSQYCESVAQLEALRSDLRNLEIDIGVISVEVDQQRLQMIGMLSSLEVHARNGDIEKARAAIGKGHEALNEMQKPAVSM